MGCLQEISKVAVFSGKKNNALVLVVAAMYFAEYQRNWESS